MFNSIMTGWYQGKGNKNFRKECFETALNYYEKALKHARKDGNIGAIAITLECLSRTHNNLNNKVSAIQCAEEGLILYKKDLQKLPFKQGAERLEALLFSLKGKGLTSSEDSLHNSPGQ
ncbi:MAG: hypothetical protein CSA26_05480 [Desulfobacterales bacterium]|nr:MAG: hypothetical protein CSA26_05480 [Desulfobacterales bacterium]